MAPWHYSGVRTLALLLLTGLLLVQAGGAASGARTYLPVAMQFLDRQHGFVELAPTRRCASCRHRIARTSDGGETWRSTSLRRLPRPAAERRFRASWRRGTHRGLQLAAVVSAKVAWATSQEASGGPSRVFLSRDGGLAWRRVAHPCARAVDFWGPLIAAPSARHAWLLCLGQPGAGQQNKALYETTDGKRWVLRRNLSGSGYGQWLAFSRSGFGLLAESRGGLLLTRDGGRTWTETRITSPEVAEPQSIALLSPSLGLVLVRDDRSRRLIELYRTRDAGQIWSLLHIWR